MPSFRGQIAVEKVEYVTTPLHADSCYNGVEGWYSLNNISSPFQEVTLGTWNVSNDVSNVSREDMCDNEDLVVLIRHKGDYMDHNAHCKILLGTLYYTIPSLNIMLSDTINSSCGANSIGRLWRKTQIPNTNENLNKMCSGQDAEGKKHYYCLRKIWCSLCRVKKSIQVYRYGPYDIYDRKFSLITDNDGSLFLKGESSTVKRINNTWVLASNLHDETVTKENAVLPIGRGAWKNSFSALSTNITFSLCPIGDFCCDDGDCVSEYGARCNGITECNDRSDEAHCSFIERDPGYIQGQMPFKKVVRKKESRETLLLNYFISINYVSDIFSSNGKMTIDFFMYTYWHDNRLTFWNLHLKKLLPHNEIWTPDFSFTTSAEAGLDLKPSITEQDLYGINLEVVDTTAFIPEHMIGPHMGKMTMKEISG